MPKPTDIRITGVTLYFLPVQTRVPLKFGHETLTSVTCARACVRVEDRRGRAAEGWGETPLSVQWAWPSSRPYQERHQAMKDFCIRLARDWTNFAGIGHPLELGADFTEHILAKSLAETNDPRPLAPALSPAPSGGEGEKLPQLAALICSSPFDLALHDAYGNLHQRPTYETYTAEFMNRSLGDFLEPADDCPGNFTGRHPRDFLLPERKQELPAWHLVGGLDLLEASELTGAEPNDGYPVALTDWIRTDGLKALKVKLRGNDVEWDFQRMQRVGEIALAAGVGWLSADFNCTVREPAYVNEVLDRLQREQPRIHDRLAYVEQPFPYDLEANQIEVRAVAARKPLFLDESAHDWRVVRLGRRLGWNGVALKTCKTQTGAILSACWAKHHGLSLMVQDLTNPMLAQIPHVLLAAHVGTLFGVETNAMQFYPDASGCEAAVHPGLYRRRGGLVNLTTIGAKGLGYRVEEIQRDLPAPTTQY